MEACNPFKWRSYQRVNETRKIQVWICARVTLQCMRETDYVCWIGRGQKKPRKPIKPIKSRKPRKRLRRLRMGPNKCWFVFAKIRKAPPVRNIGCLEYNPARTDDFIHKCGTGVQQQQYTEQHTFLAMSSARLAFVASCFVTIDMLIKRVYFDSSSVSFSFSFSLSHFVYLSMFCLPMFCLPALRRVYIYNHVHTYTHIGGCVRLTCIWLYIYMTWEFQETRVQE